MENYICAIRSPFSKYQHFVYVDHRNRVAPGLMKKRGIKEYINRIANINNTNYLLIDCDKEYGEKAQMPEAMFSCGGTICDEKIAEYESEKRKKHDFRP